MTPDFPPAHGGIQLLMGRLASGLGSLDPEVVTLAQPGAEGFDRELPFAVARVARPRLVGNRAAVARLNAVAVRRALPDRPDIVVCGHVSTSPAGAILRRLGTPMVVYLHGDEARLRPRVVSFGVSRADAVIAVSRHTRELAVRAGADPDRVHVVNPGIDPAPTTMVERDPVPTILTVSRLHDLYKGHDVMLRALPLVRSRVPDARWVVIGDGPLRPWLEHLSRSAGTSPAVQFLGSVSDRERDEWLARAHVFAMPSGAPPGGVGGEGFGIAYLEAAARGAPVVAAAFGGALDAVVDGETGRLVAPGDHVALAGALTELLLDPDRGRALGAAGRDRAASFSWARHAAVVEDLAADLIGRR